MSMNAGTFLKTKDVKLYNLNFVSGGCVYHQTTYMYTAAQGQTDNANLLINYNRYL